jgi:hypothetical protein
MTRNPTLVTKVTAVQGSLGLDFNWSNNANTAPPRYAPATAFRCGLLLLSFCLALLVGCAGPGGIRKQTQTPTAPTPTVPVRAPERPLTPKEYRQRALAMAERLLPPQIPDRSDWARDIATSMPALSIPLMPRKVCAVAAIIEQESSWRVDPVIPGLPAIVRRELERKLDRYLIPTWLLDVALRLESANGQTYTERIARLRTEKELSNLYEEMISELPLGKRLLGGLNPVTTGGPMQVKIDFAARTLLDRAYP